MNLGTSVCTFVNLSANGMPSYFVLGIGIEAAKNRALNTVDKYKEEVRRRFGPKGIKGTIQAAATKEKMFTFGVATGSFVAFVL